jgi:hypothetical protein
MYNREKILFVIPAAPGFYQQYDEMLEAQGGCCALCGSDFPGGRGRFVVDHCHDTGRIRGLLCNLCNVGLGALRDSPQLLQKAIHYLGENHGF